MSKVDERFDAKIDRSPGQGPHGTCHEWTKAKNGEGYGVFRVADKLVLAHRFAFERAYGPVPFGHEVHHTCVNPPCCNPACLTATPADKHPDSITVLNAAKTHCARGHVFNAENTGSRLSGARYCRLCKRDRMRARRARQTTTGGSP